MGIPGISGTSKSGATGQIKEKSTAPQTPYLASSLVPGGDQGPFHSIKQMAADFFSYIYDWVRWALNCFESDPDPLEIFSKISTNEEPAEVANDYDSAEQGLSDLALACLVKPKQSIVAFGNKQTNINAFLAALCEGSNVDQFEVKGSFFQAMAPLFQKRPKLFVRVMREVCKRAETALNAQDDQVKKVEKIKNLLDFFSEQMPKALDVIDRYPDNFAPIFEKVNFSRNGWVEALARAFIKRCRTLSQSEGVAPKGFKENLVLDVVAKKGLLLNQLSEHPRGIKGINIHNPPTAFNLHNAFGNALAMHTTHLDLESLQECLKENPIAAGVVELLRKSQPNTLKKYLKIIQTNWKESDKPLETLAALVKTNKAS